MGDSSEKTGHHPYDRVVEVAGELYDEELEVLAEVAEALLHGQTEYGALDLGRDARDFKWEALDEERDYLAYRAMQIVAERKRA